MKLEFLIIEMKIENDNFRKVLRIFVMFLQKLIYLAMFILMGCWWLLFFVVLSPEEISKFIPENAAYYVLRFADFSYYYYKLVSIVILLVVFGLLYMPLEILHSTLERWNEKKLPDKDIKNSALLSSGAGVLSSGGGGGGIDAYNRVKGEEEGGDLEGD